MVSFTTTILQFAEQGEKTGWSYIKIPAKLAQQLKPDYKKSFRVKGKLDDFAINGIALIPMGEGDFIMALKASLRKSIKKNKGAKLQVQLIVDEEKPKPPEEFMECLADSPEAMKFFKSLPLSHQNYYGTWIKNAKQKTTQEKRIAKVINALEKKFHFGQMMQSFKTDK
jgi:hypothetical protein